MSTATLNLVARLLIFAFLIIPPPGFAQGKRPDPHYKLLTSDDYVQSKNYYLLTLFQQLPEVKAILSEDTVLRAMGMHKLDSLHQALNICDRDGFCYTRHLSFSEDEITQAGERLRALYRPDNALGRLVKNHLIPSGTYILFQDLPAVDMLVKAWTQDAEGINYAIGVYADGKKPNYPNIDSISWNIRDRNYVGLLYDAASLVAGESAGQTGFFSIPLTAALRFIEMNEREQAADYEPMEKGENKAACDRIGTIKWAAYKYSLIMVPGAGPEEPGVALSAEGMLRCRLAAIQYQKGMAPLIVTSGGKVHPYKTKFCEAFEMKKYLIEKLHIPAYVILIDPHARHTTTNMRNTVRMMHRYGIPFDKAALTCTTRGQSVMIEKTLIDRCKRELNEVPYSNGKRLTETEMEFYPQPEALQINPREPLDP
jgi:hypothetical protein